jgi:hypothetical protein
LCVSCFCPPRAERTRCCDIARASIYQSCAARVVHASSAGLVVKPATVGVDDGEFYKAAHAFSVHLRAQHNLIVAMDGAKCPKGTTRWVAFGNMLKSSNTDAAFVNSSWTRDPFKRRPTIGGSWLRLCFPCLRCSPPHSQYCRGGAGPVQAPTDNWWILAASLLPVFEMLATTFTILQARNMVISQQRYEMEALVGKV